MNPAVCFDIETSFSVQDLDALFRDALVRGALLPHDMRTVRMAYEARRVQLQAAERRALAA